MPKKLELSGMSFGRLSVISESGRDKHGATLWACRCACGATSVVRGATLASGRARSCGCGVLEAARLPKKHGATKSALYRRWQAMKARCGNEKGSEFHNYGGRGITVCPRWLHSFENFAADMVAEFSEDLELDRVDVNGNYEPGNCRWATRKVQQRNKRDNHFVTIGAKTQTVQDWAEQLGIKPNTIVTRLRRGWDVADALKVANGGEP